MGVLATLAEMTHMIDFTSPVFAGKEMLFEKQACELLGVERGTLNYLLRKGADIPHYHVTSNAKMFDKTSLLDWWRAHHRNGHGVDEPPPAPRVPTVPASVPKQQQIEREHLEALRAQKTRASAKTAS